MSTVERNSYAGGAKLLTKSHLRTKKSQKHGHKFVDVHRQRGIFAPHFALELLYSISPLLFPPKRYVIRFETSQVKLTGGNANIFTSHQLVLVPHTRAPLPPPPPHHTVNCVKR